MRIRVFTVVLVALLAAALMPTSAEILPTPPGWQIERAVLVNRHGVRSPTAPNDELDKYSATAWPTWPVEPGFLSPQGEELLRLMGTYYRVLYGGRGLVQADDCPTAGTVAAWTDLSQRTRTSGAALLAGMYPRCANLPLRNQANFTVPDPLFNPQPTASCPMDLAANRTAILARLGGSFASVQRDYAASLSMMQSVLCPGGATRGAGGGSCGEAGTPNSIVGGTEDGVRLRGPIGYASTAAENFLMQAAEGMPKDQVAWGRLAHDASLRELLTLHQLDQDLTQKTKPIAQQRGSNLLSLIGAILVNGHSFPGHAATGQPVRLGFLVGHESNIHNIAALLDLTWQIPGFLPGEASPGGALAFEQFREVRSEKRYVRIAYYAQTLDEMRHRSPLSYRDPAGMVQVALPACSADLVNNACPLETFLKIVKTAVDPGCVTATPGNY
ncbi:histidine-type phosphatase [uncultured Reyranella sp.]|uniref:histidine-type phosphatase n=1 Tax=uncultured Reyranella sp. TaxID=735512 RepID=UPI0025CDD4CE|nr:histidine-type phosphatase [uncultured Reyranella sp.]